MPVRRHGPGRHDRERSVTASQPRRRTSPSAAGRQRAPAPGRRPHTVGRAEIARSSTAMPHRARPWPASLARQRDRSHPPGASPGSLRTKRNPQIPIDPEPRLHPRGFLPWRLSDAGPAPSQHVDGRHPKPFTVADVGDITQLRTGMEPGRSPLRARPELATD